MESISWSYRSIEDLLLMQGNIRSWTMSVLERFVILMYDCTSDITGINEARKQLFTRKSRSLENLPPTLAALEQHVRRVCYQSNCWKTRLWFLTQTFQAQQIGDGRKLKLDGKHCGPPFQKHHSHVQNWFGMAARKNVLGDASVSRQPSNVLHFVFVLVIVSNLLSWSVLVLSINLQTSNSLPMLHR